VSIVSASQTTPVPQPSLFVWLELVILGAIWGGSFFFAKIAVAEIPPLLLVFLRVSIAAVVLIAALGWRMHKDFRHALLRWRAFLLLGLLNNALPFSLIFLGQTKIGAGLAAIFNATTPLWTALAANALTNDDRLTPGRTGGILIGIAGAVIMIGADPLFDTGGAIWAKLAVVGATISYAFGAIYSRRFREFKPQTISAGQLTASTLMMMPIVFFTSGLTPLISASGGVLAAVLALAIVSTAFAYNLYFDIIKKAGATNATLVTLIIPAFAILLGASFLSERLSVHEIAGMAMIAAGLLIFDGRVTKKVLLASSKYRP
jgi:drug/metabolite transporter (DMT)-like permease